MKHWLYGALIFIVLLIFLFGMLFTVYSIKRVDCSEFIKPSSSKSIEAVSSNFLSSNDNIFDLNKNNKSKKHTNLIELQQQQQQSFINFNKFLTLRGHRKCAERLSAHGNVLWNMRPCEKQYDDYCFNGGACLTFEDRFKDPYRDGKYEGSLVLICRCAHNFQGNRCQISFNPDLYGYSIERNEVETAAFSTLVTVLIICFLVVSCCFYIYKRYDKHGELSSFKTSSVVFHSSGSKINSGATVTIEEVISKSPNNFIV